MDMKKLQGLVAELKKKVDALGAAEADKPTVSIEVAKCALQNLPGGVDEKLTETAITKAKESGAFDQPAKTFWI